MQFRVIVVTDPTTHTHPQTDRTDYNTLRRSLAHSVMQYHHNISLPAAATCTESSFFTGTDASSVTEHVALSAVFVDGISKSCFPTLGSTLLDG